MATPISKLDNFKLETRFGDGYVDNSTYEWNLSTKRATGLKRWTRVKMIGAGTFGSVWLEKELGGQLRAVKMIQRHVIDTTGFSQELAALITLSDHSHLFVQFFGWFESAHEIFLATEYISEGDMSRYMADHETAKSNAAEITKQILEGLQVLHDEGICHRDLKPQNILVACREPIWVKIADFGTSKRSTHTALRTRCGTDGYIAPELLGLLNRRLSKAEEFSFALDIWSLGCLVYQLLTSQRIFCDVNDSEAGSLTGLDTSFDMEEPQVNMELLFGYCAGRTEFPSAVLRAAQVPTVAIDLVQSLLVPDPNARATAFGALQSPWLTSIDFKNQWFKRLEADFLELGIDLDLGMRQDKTLMRQIRLMDVARFLPTSAVNNLPALLEQAIHKGLHNASWMLVNSPGRIVKDPTGVQRLFEQAVREKELRWVKILFQVGNVDVNQTGNDGKTAAEVAVCDGQHEILRLLMNNNAKVDTAAEGSHESRTILQAAAGRGYIAVVQLLLEDRKNIETIINAKPADIAGRTALQAAAENGHIDVMQLLISNGADINAKPARLNGRTALQAAAESGHLDAAILLLRNNADVNADRKTLNGTTALRAAAINGHIDMVRLLLEHDADVSESPEGNTTALQAVVESGRLDIVQLLLEFKTNIYDEAVQHAVLNGSIGILKLLLECNANVNYDRSGKSALQVAIENGRLDIVQLLLDFEANVRDAAVHRAVSDGRIDLVEVLLVHNQNLDYCEGGRTALQVGIENGRLDIVQLLLMYKAKITGETFQMTVHDGDIDMVRVLLENKADVNSGISSKTALQVAVESSSIGVVTLLLKYKAEITDESFHSSIRRGHLDTIRLLLVNNANVNCNSRGSTPLHVAVETGNIEVVKVLLQTGADVDQQAITQGRTALQSAAGNGKLDLVKLLVARNANINAEPAAHSGRTALQAAAQGGHLDVATFLLESGAAVNANPATVGGRTALQSAAGKGHIEMVKLLVARNANINAEPAQQSGLTALQAAAQDGHLDVATFLLESGAAVNANPATVGGRTALQSAAGEGHIEMVKLLVARNANINAEPARHSGLTALQAAAQGRYLGVARFLLQQNANPNAKPGRNGGKTAIEAARENYDFAMINLLERHNARTRSRMRQFRISTNDLSQRFQRSLVNHVWKTRTVLAMICRSTFFKVMIVVAFCCIIAITVFSVLSRKK